MYISGSTSFFISDDPSGEPVIGTIATVNGKAYLVVSWLSTIATGARIPIELAPLDLLSPVGDDAHFLATLVPKELFDHPIPERIRRAYGVIQAPSIAQTRGPGSIH